MDSPDQLDRGDSPERLLQIHQVLDECIDRRIAGEAIGDDEIVAHHSHLMPELGEELRNLAVIERARRRFADSSTQTGAGGVRDRAQPRIPPGAPPDFFPGYEILEEIHRGGQGVVYRAVQESTRRDVAIKITRDGCFTGPREAARLEREIRILATLRHPNIVAIHDCGTAAGGCAYYVMDYIDGEQLDEYLASDDTRRIHSDGPGRPRASPARPTDELRSRLQLFAKVCDAVNAAHLRGIIHRDLKPGNILIDKTGEPRILDFGLAKVTDDPGETASSEISLPTMTLTGQFVGSLPWSSPEQVEGAADVDLRTDVYSLGVVLYQVLVGQFPYPVSGSMKEVLDNVIHAEPAPPRSLRGDLDDEIETILLKCLSKDRQRRYQTAGELAQDIRLYLAGDPISAKRDSGWYVVKKSLRRHRLAVTMAGLLILMIAVSAVALGVMYGIQTRERKRAEDQTRIAQRERDRAVTAERISGQRLIETTAARDAELKARNAAEGTVQYLLNVLEQADPRSVTHGDVTVREVLEEAGKQVESEFADQPLTEAAVRNMIGKALSILGKFDDAENHLRQALAIRQSELGPRHPDIAESLLQLGHLLDRKGQLAEAESLYREALEMRSHFPDDGGYELAAIKRQLGLNLNQQGRPAESEPLLREVLETRRKTGRKNLSLAHALSGLAILLYESGRYDEAEPLFLEALDVYGQLPDGQDLNVAGCEANLGMLHIARGDYDAAEPLLEHSLSELRRLLGESSPDVAEAYGRLAGVAYVRGNYARTKELLESALTIADSIYDSNSPRLADWRYNLATICQREGDYDRAEKLLRQVLAQLRASLGPQNPGVATVLEGLALLKYDLAQLDEAEAMFRETLDIRRKTLHADDQAIADAADNLGSLLLDKGDYEQGESLLREALEMRRRLLPADHPDLANSLSNLSKVLRRKGDYIGEEKLLRECLAIRTTKMPNHWLPAVSMSRLGASLTFQSRFDEAEPLLLESCAKLQENPYAPPHFKERSIANVVELYEAWGKGELAEEWRGKMGD